MIAWNLQVCQNPPKLRKPTRVTWKDVPVLFSLKAGRKNLTNRHENHPTPTPSLCAPEWCWSFLLSSTGCSHHTGQLAKFGWILTYLKISPEMALTQLLPRAIQLSDVSICNTSELVLFVQFYWFLNLRISSDIHLLAASRGKKSCVKLISSENKVTIWELW